MAVHRFEGAYLKLERANHHITDLERRIAEFMADEPFETVVTVDKKTQQETVAIKAKSPIPPCLSLIIGDAIHNLRSALDFAIFGLIGKGAVDNEKIHFPFCREGKDFESVLTNRQIHSAGKMVVAAIRNLKPYGDGDKVLYAIHIMDVRDKHTTFILTGQSMQIVANEARKLHPALGIFAGPGVLAPTNIKGNKPFVITDPNLRPRNVRRAEAKKGRFVEQRADHQLPVLICFGKDEFLAGSIVTPTLRDMATKVESALKALTAATRKQSRRGR